MHRHHCHQHHHCNSDHEHEQSSSPNCNWPKCNHIKRQNESQDFWASTIITSIWNLKRISFQAQIAEFHVSIVCLNISALQWCWKGEIVRSPKWCFSLSGEKAKRLRLIHTKQSQTKQSWTQEEEEGGGDGVGRDGKKIETHSHKAISNPRLRNGIRLRNRADEVWNSISWIFSKTQTNIKESLLS